MYAGVDPDDRSSIKIKKLIKIPVNLGKYGGDTGFYCLEETSI